MKRAMQLVLFSLALIATPACTVTRSLDCGGTTVEWHILESIVESFKSKPKRKDTEVDRLWRQGYGFNNPNVERIRSGQPLLNFDGSVYKP